MIGANTLGVALVPLEPVSLKTRSIVSGAKGLPSALVLVNCSVSPAAAEASRVKLPAETVKRRLVASTPATPSPTQARVVLEPKVRLSASNVAEPSELLTPPSARRVTRSEPAAKVSRPSKVLAVLSRLTPPAPAPPRVSVPDPETTPLTTRALAELLVQAWLPPTTSPTLALKVVRPEVASSVMPEVPSVIVCAAAEVSVNAALRKTKPCRLGLKLSVTVPVVPAK